MVPSTDDGGLAEPTTEAGAPTGEATPPTDSGDPSDQAQTAEPGPEHGEEDGLEWNRPHPFTIVIEIGAALRSMGIALVAVGGGFLNAGSAIELLVISGPLAAALARWYTTRYALGPQSIHHQYGLVRRRRQVLPRANVQNVSTKAGLVARIGSVVEVQISDASATGDIKLRLVSQEEAERITTLLRSELPTTGAGAGESSVPAGAEGPADGVATGQTPIGPAPSGQPIWRPALVAPSIGRLVRTELTSLSTAGQLLIVVAVATAVPIVVSRIPTDQTPPPPLLGAAALGFGVLGVLLGIAARVSVFGGFELRTDPDRLRIQAGLLTEAKVAARRERLQLLEVQRDATHRRVGLERVRYETADVELQGTAATVYLDPSAPRDQWRTLADEAMGGTELTEDDLRPVSPRTVRRALLRTLPQVAVTTAAMAWVWWPAAIVGAAVGLALGRWYARRRYQELGWALDDQHCLVRGGVLAGRLWLVRVDKIQAVRTRATLFQRRLGLATVLLSTAGTGGIGLVTIPDLPVDEADELVTRLAHRAARTALADTL